MRKKTYLTLSEELELGRIIKAYRNNTDTVNYEEAEAAHLKLFENNVESVYRIVHKFLNQTNSFYYPLEDALQDALLEFSKRIWEYDPDYNCKVMTRIYWWIKKVLSNNSNKMRPIPFTPTAGYKWYIIKNLLEEYKKLNNSKISELEFIREKTKYKDSEIVGILESMNNLTSLHYTIEEDGKATYIMDLIEEDNPRNVLISDSTENLLSQLTEKEKYIIYYEFDLEDSKNTDLYNVLEKLNMTERQYKKEVRRILRKLKELAQTKDDKDV